MNTSKYEISNCSSEYPLCCLNCREVVETTRDWESYTLYCIMCGEDMNDFEDFLDLEDE